MEGVALEKIGIIILLNFLLYCRTLSFKFVSDDFSVWKNPPAFKNAWHKAWLRFIGAAKCLSPSIHIVRSEQTKKWYLAFLKTEMLEHLLTIVIHTCICVAIYFAFGQSDISFIASLLYSTNPINNQGTIWPGGRGYALPILCILLSMCLPNLSNISEYYSQYEPTAKYIVEFVAIVIALSAVATILLGFCSWFTIGFLAPLVFIGFDNWWLLLIIPLAWILNVKKFTKAVGNKIKTETYDEDKKIHPKKLILGIKTLGFYTLLCLIPFRVTFYHNFLQSSAGSMRHKNYTLCRYFWLGFLTISSCIAYWYYVPWNTLSWALLAYLIAIAPFCNVIRANQEIAERFACFGNLFLMYALAQVIYPYPIAMAVIITFYATRTFYTLLMYKDEYWITEVSRIEDRYAWWCWHCCAMKAWDQQSYKHALIMWVMARMISPREFKVLMNIATCLRILKNNAEADQYLKLAEENIVPGQEKQSLEFIANHRKGKLPILL